VPLTGSLGAEVRAGPSTRFLLYAERAQRCAVRLFHDVDTPLATLPMHALGDGYHALHAEDVGHGALYKFVVDDVELPDPYARFLPYGVHGPAMAIEPRYTFRHARPTASEQPILYELHIGTFTEQGTYRAAGLCLPMLRELGVTAIELLPVAAFQGARGWGYDGVALFAPFAPYGSPDELRAFVDTAHGLGLSVLLDVVYNHFGPSGNYLAAYSPSYFHADKGAWGDAPNYENAIMRALAADNARYWLEEFRFDGLRLDAVHAIVDHSERHVLTEIVESARRACPSALLIAEDDRNEPALVLEQGLDAIWADDFHHQLHVTLTGERDGYYAAYEPGVAALAHTIERGFLYEGQSFAPTQKPRGKPADALAARAFVYALQNHDQIGNRALGERLSATITGEAYVMASALLLFLPMTPLLFMGQEWAAASPFLFFTDHDAALGEQVVKGRREEFKGFRAFSDEAARARIPDPQAVETFLRSKLNWQERESEAHAFVLAQYRALIALRRNDHVLTHAGRSGMTARAFGNLLVVTRRYGDEARSFVANFARAAHALPSEIEGDVLFASLPSPSGPLSPTDLLSPDRGSTTAPQRDSSDPTTRDLVLPAHAFVILAHVGPTQGE
jgi:maltooligosyltrehalose trehalohydrolase